MPTRTLALRPHKRTDPTATVEGSDFLILFHLNNIGVKLVIDLFKSVEGKFPVEKHLDELDGKQAAKLSAIKLTQPAPSVYQKKMVATDEL